jgi:arylsulfatase A-like enzyme
LRQPRACAFRRLEPIWIGSLDITDNTIVIFISDNGAETFEAVRRGTVNHRALIGAAWSRLAVFLGTT